MEPNEKILIIQIFTDQGDGENCTGGFINFERTMIAYKTVDCWVDATTNCSYLDSIPNSGIGYGYCLY